MILPSSSTLTTDGQSGEPYGPGIHFGAPVCGSRYAIRLKVVPRSMPTTRPILPLRENLMLIVSTASLYKGQIPRSAREKSLRLLVPKLRPVLFARRLRDCGCSFGDSALRSYEPAKLASWLHPRRRREPHPIPDRFA